MAGRHKGGGKRSTAPVPRHRRAWTIKPAQKPHSTRKGARGYDRRRLKRTDGLDDPFPGTV